jgi:alpha-1,2-mannosyltransferase
MERLEPGKRCYPIPCRDDHTICCTEFTSDMQRRLSHASPGKVCDHCFDMGGSKERGPSRLLQALPATQQLVFLLPAAAFVLLVLVTSVRIALGYPDQSSFHIYETAVLAWWLGANPYTSGILGFLYLPPYLVLFTPFALLGPRIGGILWCLLSAGLYASGLFRVSRQLSPTQPWQVLGVALLAVWFSLKANLSDGQAQVIMTGLLLHTAADLRLERWPQAAAQLALAVIFKPIALATLGLAFVLYPPLRKWLLLAILFAALLPFLHPDPSFVATEYRAALAKLLVAATPGRGDWPWLADISTLLDAVGLPFNELDQLALRTVAALATLVIVIWAQNLDRWSTNFVLLTLSLIYLTLFNPRTESVSYVALTPAIGLSAGLQLSCYSRETLGWLLLVAGVALGVSWSQPIDPWLKPAIALIYFVLIGCVIICRCRAQWLGSSDTNSGREEPPIRLRQRAKRRAH